MIPLQTQYRIMDRVKSDPRRFAALEGCSDPNRAHTAYLGACIQWMHRGGKKELERRAEQAQALRDALAVMAEYRDILEQNLVHPLSNSIGPHLKPDSQLEASPVLSGVEWAMGLLASDLLERNPETMLERKDRQFYLLLGREFKKYEIARPPVHVLRELFEILAGSVAKTGMIAPGDSLEDSDIIKTFKLGSG
ncbi:hypothetical protein HFU84_01680 [Acidithiobacillus sp. CV18-2]|nr:hypothetical protein [Acidithiobacillus sp. CV18-3]MBU2758167.1 hypothetical protein [Acidithiobacillus sp. BN09-2]MBU2776247.1 hypothetical protein [Acidithiobacillus sp. CV18-2]MBU2799954.1 hypothetical protein [Acidithiobacillus sp. VAN18-4]